MVKCSSVSTVKCSLKKYIGDIRLTSTHALVVSQHVARRAHALVGAKGVHAAEGA